LPNWVHYSTYTLGWTGTAAGGGGEHGAGSTSNAGGGGGAGEFGSGKIDVSADSILTAVLGARGLGGIDITSTPSTDAADTTLAGDVSGNLLTLNGGQAADNGHQGGSGGDGLAGGAGEPGNGGSSAKGGTGYSAGNGRGPCTGSSVPPHNNANAPWGAGGDGSGPTTQDTADGGNGGYAKLIIWKIN